MKTSKPWTDEEEGYVLDTYDLPLSVVADHLGRTKEAVSHKRRYLRKGISRTQSAGWTDDEDQILWQIGASRSSHDLVSLLPGRTVRAIQCRRLKLGIPVGGGRKFGPWVVGNRPLIAKTCSKCGLLLPAQWFGFNQPGKFWKSECRKCNSRRGVAYQQKTDPNRGGRFLLMKKAWGRKAQALTLQTASKRRQEWTEAEHQVLADESLTILAKALILNRTYLGTSHKALELGYKSHTAALGNPLRDRWIIENPNLPAVQAITNEILHHMTAAERRELGWDFTDLDIAS